MQYINTIEIKYGVLIKTLLKGSLAVTLEININALRLKFNGIANIFANEKEIKDTKIEMNPNIIFIPKNGLAKIFEIKNVNEIVLNFSAIIGIIIICADIVTDNNFDILSFNLILFKMFFIFLLNNIIPIVPKYDSSKPISLIENGFIIKIINSEIDILV